MRHSLVSYRLAATGNAAQTALERRARSGGVVRPLPGIGPAQSGGSVLEHPAGRRRFEGRCVRGVGQLKPVYKQHLRVQPRESASRMPSKNLKSGRKPSPALSTSTRVRILRSEGDAMTEPQCDAIVCMAGGRPMTENESIEFGRFFQKL